MIIVISEEVKSDTESWTESTRKMELVFKEYRVFILDDEKLLEVNGSDGHTTMWMYLEMVNCILKRDQINPFYSCAFPPK